MGDTKNIISWVINPVHIILIVIILGFGITGVVFFNKYMDAKYKVEELKKTQAKAEKNIKEAEAQKDVLTKQIAGYKKKLRQWEKKYDAIKKPVNMGGVRDLLNRE